MALGERLRELLDGRTSHHLDELDLDLLPDAEVVVIRGDGDRGVRDLGVLGEPLKLHGDGVEVRVERVLLDSLDRPNDSHFFLPLRILYPPLNRMFCHITTTWHLTAWNS